MNQYKISIICPTRNRPNQLQNMMETATNFSSKQMEIEFCIYIDYDDTSYDKLLKKLNLKYEIKVLRGPRLWLSGMFNSLSIISEGDYILWCGDDVSFRTRNWDIKMTKKIDEFDEKIGLVHINDGANYAQVYATIGMVHRNWLNATGNLFTPHMKDNGIDFWITYVAEFVNRKIYLEDVLIEHLQFRQGKVDIDNTYLDRYLDQQTYNPRDLYRKLRSERRRDALLLQNKIRKEFPKLNWNFALGHFYARNLHSDGASYLSNRQIYFLTMSNLTFIKYLLFKLHLLPDNRKWE